MLTMPVSIIKHWHKSIKKAQGWLDRGGSKTGIGDILDNNFSPVLRYQFRIRVTENKETPRPCAKFLT